MCIWRIFLKSRPSVPVLEIRIILIFSPLILFPEEAAFTSEILSGDSPFSPLIKI